ncbi:MAG: LVIVD repeat-containing protein [Gemmatimonadales bacterium]
MVTVSRLRRLRRFTPFALLALAAGCGGSSSGGSMPAPMALSVRPPSPDPRVGLKAGLYDAGQAFWNMKLISTTKPSERFAGVTNSDLAFTGKYAIQGNYNGWQIWDISNPSQPTLAKAFYCPASQSDVSVYKHLLFISGEGNSGRLDCGGQGVREAVSHDRLRGLRVFDMTDITNPRNVANVQTCRGSHTHTVLADPKDPDNVYVYISGSAGVRPEGELAGCSGAAPEDDPNTALFRIEVIKVPVAHPEQAAIVSSPRIFNDLAPVKSHGAAPDDKKANEAAKARGAFVANIQGQEMILPDGFARMMLDSVVKARSGTGAATGADSAALRAALPGIIAKMIGGGGRKPTGPTQCHDITVYPGIGLAGGACEGYGLLLDIRDPANPRRIDQAADSNFSYWHSATFNNDGTKVLFSDEWGGGGGPKCRASDPHEWGADAIFTISNGKMQFQTYYKMTAPQTAFENCVAHNGSLIPIPGRDVMVQAWYQGGLSVFDWTDAKHPVEIGYFDRGPVDSTRMGNGGSWSVYWYNGVIVSSEIARGLDILELTPSPALSQNEIDAAKTVKLEYLNTQGQPKFVWPASFALARAYLDQLERGNGLGRDRITAARQALSAAEGASGGARRDGLNKLAGELDGSAGGAGDGAKVRTLASAVRALAGA